MNVSANLVDGDGDQNGLGTAENLHRYSCNAENCIGIFRFAYTFWHYSHVIRSQWLVLAIIWPSVYSVSKEAEKKRSAPNVCQIYIQVWICTPLSIHILHA